MEQRKKYVFVEERFLHEIVNTILAVFGAIDRDLGDVMIYMQNPDTEELRGYNGQGEHVVTVSNTDKQALLFCLTVELIQATISPHCRKEISALAKGLKKFPYDVYGVDYTKIADIIHEKLSEIVEKIEDIIEGNTMLTIKIPEEIHGKSSDINLSK